MNLATLDTMLPATDPETLGRIREVESKMKLMPQIDVRTEHVLHAGMYARTVKLEAGQAIVGVLIKIPTILVVNGHCAVYANGRWNPIIGYHVIQAEAGRKQMFVAFKQTELTMLFRTEAKTLQEAEAEFTDEADNLLSRRQECQA